MREFSYVKSGLKVGGRIANRPRIWEEFSTTKERSQKPWRKRTSEKDQPYGNVPFTIEEEEGEQYSDVPTLKTKTNRSNTPKNV